MQSHIDTREAWLTLFSEKYLLPRIIASGGVRPEKYRVSVGFPRGHRGSKGHAIGQCWSRESSADRTYEIFISPEVPANLAVMTLSHELTHASVGLACGHGAPFKKIAMAIGLTGPMRATVATAEFGAAIQSWIAAEPPYPHAPLSASTASPKPGSRLLKASCEHCGYTVRVTRQWLDIAAPLCPNPACTGFRVSMTAG